MDIFLVDSSEIARIGEIDRTEIIEAKYKCTLLPDSNTIELQKEEIEPPETFPNWDDKGVRRRAKWWKRAVDEGGALFFAEDNGILLGFAVLGPKKAGQCAEIVALFVDKEHRGKGVGRKLIRRLENEARERGIEAIYVHANETVASVEFYKGVGYRIACLMDTSTIWLPGLETSIILARRI